jgi:hypothetical protein
MALDAVPEAGGRETVMTVALNLASAAWLLAGIVAASAETDAPPATAFRPVPTLSPGAPAAPATTDTSRVFLDTRVTDVRVGRDLTVATLARSPQSACPSSQYVYERSRPKWLFETGRLLLAMKEGALVRISFRCVRGLQSINAMQFLSAATALRSDGTPRPGEVVRVAPDPAGATADPRPPSADTARSVPTP